MIRTMSICCLIVLAPAGITRAEPPGKPDGLTAPSGDLRDLKDPTVPSKKLSDALNPKKGVAPAAPGASRVPGLSLRGRIIVKGKPPTVLLEVDSKLYTVSKDSLVPGGGGTILKVVEVTSTEVRLEVRPQNEVIVLR